MRHAALVFALLILGCAPPPDAAQDARLLPEPLASAAVTPPETNDFPEPDLQDPNPVKASPPPQETAAGGERRRQQATGGVPADHEFEELMRQRVDASFARTYCPHPRKHDDAYYSGPLIDSHLHIPHVPDSTQGEDFGAPSGRPPYMGVDITIDEIVCVLGYEGTQAAISFFTVFPRVADRHLEFASRAAQKHPDVFIPFISPPDEKESTVDAGVLSNMLGAYPGLFKGFGEIGLYNHSNDPDGLPPDSPRLLGIYRLIREQGLVVYFHLGEGQQPNYEAALEANPDINFIFHGDQLIAYEDGTQNLDAIEEILRNHPNVHYTVDELYGDEWLLRRALTKEGFLAHFKDYAPLLREDLATWKAIIERYPDQFMWGTDRGGDAAWSLDREVGWTLNDYGRAFIARLDPTAQEKFAYKNAERLFAADHPQT